MYKEILFFKTGPIIAEDGYRKTYNEGNFRNYGGTLSFKHNFAKAGKELTADANYNYRKNDNLGDYFTQYYTNGAFKSMLYEQSLGGGTNNALVVQTDYVNPISDKIKIEMGARGAFSSFVSFNNNYDKKSSSEAFKLLPGFSNNYKFTDQVLAAYTTFSQQIKKFTYQLGLRLESSKYNGDLVSQAKQFSNKYPFSLFPSAFFTYKLTDKQDMQLNYSRKINRPNFFQLIPFFDYSDPLNLSIGNPNLVPEFTNLVEVGYQNQLNKNHSILATLYFRNTTDLITRYQYKDKNPDTSSKPKPDSVLISSYINANTATTVGLELTSKDKITKWWDLTANLNLFNSTLKAGSVVGGGSNSQFSWFGKLNNNFKLPKNYSIQLSGDYQAKTILPPSSSGGGSRGGGMMMGGGFGQTQTGAQGYIKPNYGVDIAIKKEFLKNNTASLTLQVNDIFRTKVYATHSQDVYFIQDNQRRRDPQVVRLNFNWRFGKFDIALFKRKNMKGEMEGMQGAQQGMGQ
ncbi:MAG: TonB-dependent receptor family protein [Chitinophagaceae bacterium]|nr:TonB-dependent receptor family protein [Chitinophagaceae bacterium]